MSHTHKLAWAAGFFDGEGYVNIQRRSHPLYVGYYLRIGINHVAPEPLYEMQKLFGGSVKKQPEHTVSGNRHRRHTWITSTSNAAEALKQMMPYFMNKNNVAELALDFQKTIGPRGQQTPQDIQDKREWIKAEVQRLNSLD